MTASLAYWVIAFLLGVLGGTILYMALFADRARGRLRCPKCWYDMQGADPASLLRCPECGHNAKREKRLSRTRRRWRLAFVGAIVLIAAGVSALQPKAQRDGWASIVPTTVLIYAPRFIENENLVGELFARLSQPNDVSPLHSVEAWIMGDRLYLYSMDTAEMCLRNSRNAASHRRFTDLLGQGLQWPKLDSGRRDSITQLFVKRLDHPDNRVRWDATRALQNAYSPPAFVERLKPLSMSDDVRDRLRVTDSLDAMMWSGDEYAIAGHQGAPIPNTSLRRVQSHHDRIARILGHRVPARRPRRHHPLYRTLRRSRPWPAALPEVLV